ncbi:hypothetical protein CYY_001770 [Polysphondylium violaceum]|uniref:MRH domain-containing protein n=1 Tax=Polysphondylium violaceum TaxID=133409 RepID=A0A8J4Q2H3_9MYCE|nr:hypothetical protein CYY_001770 [Polysphondylium violaceum]
MLKLSITLSLLLCIVAINAQTTPNTCNYSFSYLDFNLGPFTNQSYGIGLSESESIYLSVCGPNPYCTEMLGYDVSFCSDSESGVVDLGVPSTGVFSRYGKSIGKPGIILTTQSKGLCSGNTPYTSKTIMQCKQGAASTIYRGEFTSECEVSVYLYGNAACPGQ